MDAACTIQDSIHVFSLVRKYVSRILGTYQSLATIGGALHSLLGFLFAVSSMQEEIKDLCSISPLDNLHSLLH